MRWVSEFGATPKRLGLIAYLSCIRYTEVLVLQGSPLLGAAFSIGAPTGDKALVGALFAVASFLLVAHIWTFNDWAGLATDLNDPHRSSRVFLTRGVSSRGLLAFSAILLAASLASFGPLPHRTLVIAVIIAALGILYSHPAANAKSIPVLSSMPHLLGGLLHFLLGYSVFQPIDRRGVLIALFFSLTFTAGHLNQEVRDADVDRANGLDTNAVHFGKRGTFLAGLVLFTVAYADLVWLAYGNLVPALLGVLPVALYPIHLAWSLRTLRNGLDFERVSRLQRVYRLLYGLIGLGMLAALVLR
jgi:4-hydroxybenzoate polyprenyltransferase